MVTMITTVARVMATMQDDASNCDHDCSSQSPNRRFRSIRRCWEIGVRTIPIRFGSLHVCRLPVIWVGINARRVPLLSTGFIDVCCAASI